MSLIKLTWWKKRRSGKPILYKTTDDFLSHFNLQKLSDLPTVDELGAAGLIDSSNIDNAIFGTGKFYKEKQDGKKKIFIQILTKCSVALLNLRIKNSYS